MKRKQLFESIELVQEKYKDDENNLWGFCTGVKDYISSLEKRVKNQQVKYKIIMKSGREYFFDAHYSELSLDEIMDMIQTGFGDIVRFNEYLVLDTREIESIQQLN